MCEWVLDDLFFLKHQFLTTYRIFKKYIYIPDISVFLFLCRLPIEKVHKRKKKDKNFIHRYPDASV